MPKRKQLFESIPLRDISHVLGDQKPAGSPPERNSDSPDNSKPLAKKPTTVVQKTRLPRKAWPKTDEEDRSIESWLNKDIFRKQREQATQIVLHGPLASTNNRYLALADQALGKNNAKSKRKASEEGLAMR